MKEKLDSVVVSTTIETPIGRLGVAASPRGLSGVDFHPGQAGNGERAASGPGADAARRHLEEAVQQLQDYFAGRRSTFDVPLDLTGTPYQQRVWRALLRIPAGKTLSYGEVAKLLGSPAAARAVGRACATNPVPVVVPCHRVVGSDGKLHGFGGGLWRKEKLLELERPAR
jgi:methylated-DNA-[protein]-cysteine S-methyltransferase